MWINPKSLHAVWRESSSIVLLIGHSEQAIPISDDMDQEADKVIANLVSEIDGVACNDEFLYAARASNQLSVRDLIAKAPTTAIKRALSYAAILLHLDGKDSCQPILDLPQSEWASRVVGCGKVRASQIRRFLQTQGLVKR